MSKLKVGDKLVVVKSDGWHCQLSEGRQVEVLQSRVGSKGNIVYDITGGWVMSCTNRGYELKGVGVYLEKVPTKLTRTQLTEIAEAKSKAFDAMAERLVALEVENKWIIHRLGLDEKPKITGSDLTRQMLKDGAESVKYYVDDNSDDGATQDAMAVRITKFEDGVFYSVSGCPWCYAVPVSSLGAKP